MVGLQDDVRRVYSRETTVKYTKSKRKCEEKRVEKKKKQTREAAATLNSMNVFHYQCGRFHSDFPDIDNSNTWNKVKVQKLLEENKSVIVKRVAGNNTCNDEDN